MTSILNTELDILCIINPKRDIIFRNGSYKTFFKDLIKISLPEKISDDDRPIENSFLKEFTKKINISLLKGIETNFEYYHAEGEQHFYSFNSLPLINENNSIECVVIQGRRLSSTKTSDSKSSLLFEKSFFVHIQCDNKFTILNLITNTGQTEQDLANRDLSTVFPKGLYDSISRKGSRLKNQGLIIEFQHNFMKDGESVNADIKLFKSNDGFNIILEDLTNKSQKDKELRKFVEELHYNKIISEQYAKELSLVNRKLNESEEELRKLNRDKDKFFSIVAHDLRNPFSSLLGFSDYLAKEAENLTIDEIKTFANSIYSSGRHLLSLLENLLQWSRVQLGRIEFKPEEYIVYEQILTISGLYTHVAQQKNIEIIIDVKHNVKINADKNMIETVLRNLVSNSLKFTREGGSITLKVIKRKSQIEILVIDTGVGMSAEDQDKLFRIDTQHTTPGTRNEHGSGLGLLICKEFLEKNSGKIKVKSKIGVGTTFTLVLPITNSSGNESKKEVRTKVSKTSGYKFSK